MTGMPDQPQPEPPSPFGQPSALPPDPGNIQQRKRTALIAMVGVAFLLGAVDTWLFGPPGPLEGGRLLAAVVGNAVPAWLNIGIVLVAVGFVPYYFYKTRPAGRRGIPIAGFFAMVVAVSLAMSFGAALLAILSGDPGSASTTPI